MLALSSVDRVVNLVTIVGFSCAMLSACGDDSGGGTGDGCTTDVECKGDRICIDRVCVDPEDAMGTGDGGPSSGDGGHGGTGGGNQPVDDPELEEACSASCEAQHAAQCEMQTGSLDQCRGQCLIVDEQGYAFCHDEQTAQYACLAAGGYTCVSGYAQAKSTCVVESQALNECLQSAPCRSFCDRAQGECAPSGEACLTDCLEKQDSFEDAICDYYYSSLVDCWGRDLVCNGDIPAVEPCGAQAAEVADCVGRREHECDGFCWAAEALGCGSEDCNATCRAKADETYCGSYYRSLLDCTFGNRALQMTCENGEPTPSAECDSANMQYTTCMSSM